MKINEEQELKALGEERLSTEEIYNGKILHVIKDSVRMPDGDLRTRELVRHIGAVCVMPVTEDGKVIVERQFRYPIGKVITEIPAGKLDSKDEDRLSAAKRELREETGLTADEWTDLGYYFPTAAYSDEKISMYMARGLHQGQQELDPGEFLDVCEVPLEELIEEVMNGGIPDGKTQAAILKGARILGK